MARTNYLDDSDSAEVIEYAAKFEDLPNTPEAKPLREEYLSKEINRLIDEGKPVLRAILARPGDTGQCIDESLWLLSHGYSGGEDGGGIPIRAVRSVMLRLRDGAVPPSVDPNGRRLAPGQLVAKLGNVGGDVDTRVERRGVDAQKREQLKALKRMFRVSEAVTSEPWDFSLDDAVMILRAWGYGIAVRIKHDHRDKADVSHADTWLVEEVVHQRRPVREAVPEGKQPAAQPQGKAK